MNKARWLGSAAAAVLALAGMAAARAEGSGYPGITEPVVDVALSLPVAGIVTVRQHKEGDFVRAGDVILELDERLEELELDRRRLLMDNHRADWESTKSVFDKTSSISRDDLLKKETDYRVAVAEYQIAAEQLRRRKLIAPADGIITEINLQVGEACTAYQPAAHLVDTRRCYFITNVDGSQSAHLQVGQAVRLVIDEAGGPEEVRARLAFVSPVVDSASGLQRVKALFDNADGRIRPGLAGKMFRD
jgi:RND family efflux transporter MFP subunit